MPPGLRVPFLMRAFQHTTSDNCGHPPPKKAGILRRMNTPAKTPAAPHPVSTRQPRLRGLSAFRTCGCLWLAHPLFQLVFNFPGARSFCPHKPPLSIPTDRSISKMAIPISFVPADPVLATRSQAKDRPVSREHRCSPSEMYFSDGIRKGRLPWIRERKLGI